MTYKPTQSDIQWAESMMAILRDGAVLVYPNSLLVYKVDHKNKLLTLQNPIVTLDKRVAKIHQKTIDTFKAIGYSVVIKHDA